MRWLKETKMEKTRREQIYLGYEARCCDNCSDLGNLGFFSVHQATYILSLEQPLKMEPSPSAAQIILSLSCSMYPWMHDGWASYVIFRTTYA